MNVTRFVAAIVALGLAAQAQALNWDQADPLGEFNRAKTEQSSADRPPVTVVQAVVVESGDVSLARALLGELHRTENVSYSLDLIERLQRLVLNNSRDFSLHLIVGEGIVRDLLRASKVEYSHRVVGVLERFVLATPFPQARAVVVGGLGDDLRRATNSSYSLYVVETLGRIAGRNEESQKGIVQVILDDVYRAGNVNYSRDAASVAARVASRSSSGEVKDLTVSLLMREVRRTTNVDYSRFLLDLVDQVRR